MKVHWMSREQDFGLDNSLPTNYRDLEQDLGLDALWATMAQGDALVAEVARQAVLCSLTEVDAILYRQQVVADCLNAPDMVRAMYQMALDTLETRRKNWLGIFTNHPSAIVRSAVELLKLLTRSLMSLRTLADTHGHDLHSEGLKTFVAMLQTELDDAYFKQIQEQLNRLGRSGILLSAQLGAGHLGTHYTLVIDPESERSALGRMLSRKSPAYTFHVDPRDEAGHRTLAELEDAGLNLAANALAQAADHILAFFEQLKLELAFFVGCLNLYDHLLAKEEPCCMPEPVAMDTRVRNCRGLYDLGLSLNLNSRVVGNDLDADGAELIIVTGANQGGKSTFLRSLGIAQLMMQSGMFVSAEAFQATLVQGLFTHFRRQEDASMESGKLDEELSRMSALADHIRAGSLVLFNESFMSTNEREGSEIFRQITDALLDCRVQVVSVSHLYTYANHYYTQGTRSAVFLRAERERTFRLVTGRPMSTSFGKDLYERVFNQSADDAGH